MLWVCDNDMVDDKKRNNFMLSIYPFIKRGLRSVLKEETLKVEFDNKKGFSPLITHLEKIHQEIVELRNHGINMPSTTLDLDLDSGIEDNLKSFNEGVNRLEELSRSSIDGLKEIQDNLTSLNEKAEKLYLKEAPSINIPEVKFPQIQPVSGTVKISNQVDLSELSLISKKLESVIEAIRNIKLPEFKEIKFPEIKFPQQKDKLSLVEANQIIEAINKLQTSIDKIPSQLPETKFPTSISVSNFPPQKYPMPVTNISINALAGTIKSRTVTVTTNLTPLPEEVLSNRRSIIIYNNSSQIVEIGGSDFAFGDGLPIPANSYSPPIDAGSKMILYGRVVTGTADVRTLETSDLASGR